MRSTFAGNRRWTTEQGFEIVGSSSRMFARYFAEQTVKSGDVLRFQAPMVPDWFIPLAHWDHKAEHCRCGASLCSRTTMARLALSRNE